MNTYVDLIGKHEGEACFIFGAGPSLRFCATDDMFPWLGTYGIQIAINSSVIECDNFDYWISNDSLCCRWDWWKKVKRGTGIKIVRNSISRIIYVTRNRLSRIIHVVRSSLRRIIQVI